LIDGRSARGANFMRLGMDEDNKEVCHLIEVAVGMTKVAVDPHSLQRLTVSLQPPILP
jgi:hypothetical protein